MLARLAGEVRARSHSVLTGPAARVREAEVDPRRLGVHQVIGGGPMPTYVRRPHDELLRAVLDPAVPASRLVVVRGGSSTGKTRAAYEAVADRLADWQLDYPLNAAALAARLEAGIPARTVLWLGELRQYADADGGAAVLGRLADLLAGEGHLVITTVWPEQWNTYTAAARAGPGAADPAGMAGRLLERLPELTGSDPAADRSGPRRGHRRPGPSSPPPTWKPRPRTGDPVLAAAAAAAASAGQDGQVTQYLAGVPDLLDRYAGPGGDPYGQAVITAAMDATRLGHASPLPAALLQEAAVGYLTDPQRTKDIASWRDTALAWAAAELNGAVRALQPVPPPSGTGVAGYQVADYLDQHGRRTRQDQLGPASLWDALTAHATSASDLTRLGQAARDRGLYRHAAALWTTAAALGSTDAAGQLISPPAPGQPRRHHARRPMGRQPRQPRRPGGRRRAAAGAARGRGQRRGHRPCWPATRRPRQPRRPAGRRRAAAGAARGRGRRRGHRPGSPGPPPTPASTTRGPSPRCCGRCARPGPATRSPPCWPATPPPTPASTTRGPSPRCCGRCARPGPATRSRTLAGPGRRPRQPRRPAGRRRLLGRCARPGRDAVLPWPRPPPGRLDDPASPAAEALARPGPATRSRPGRGRRHASLDDPGAVAELLRALREAGAGDAVTRPGWPATRRPRQPRRPAGRRRAAAGAARGRGRRRGPHPAGPRPRRPRQPRRPAGRRRAAAGAARGRGQRRGHAPWLARAAAHASLDDPGAVAGLLQALREAGASDAVAHPAGPRPRRPRQPRRPAGRRRAAAGAARGRGQRRGPHPAGPRPRRPRQPRRPGGVAELLQALREAGASDAVRTLAARAANAGMFDLFLEVYPDEASSYLFGREPDGAPSQSWKWQEPGQLGPWSIADGGLGRPRRPSRLYNSFIHPLAETAG